MSQIQSLLIETITPKIGAEIGNVNLGNLCDREIIDIKEAFKKHLFLVFRDQQITRDQHKAFGKLFGELHLHPAKTNLGAL